MEMTEKAILQFRNLDVSFRTNAGVIHAIRGVNLDLQKGETVAIVGESGSGKSVTVKAAVGLLDANATVNSGQILYRYVDDDGNEEILDLLAMPKRELRRKINGRRIAMVFQDPMTSLDPTMPIGKQIMEGILLHTKLDKEAARKRALELLELVGIAQADCHQNNDCKNDCRKQNQAKNHLPFRIDSRALSGRCTSVLTGCSHRNAIAGFYTTRTAIWAARAKCRKLFAAAFTGYLRKHTHDLFPPFRK